MMRSIISLVFLFSCISVNAQKLNVDKFAVKPNDIKARTHPRQDINGNDCALVKVQLAAPYAIFDGNVIGDVSYETSIYNVYMSQGSKRLTIRLEGYLPLDVNFEDYDIKPLKAKTVYVMTISGIATTQAIEPVRTKTGWIILDSEPSGASVYINDEFVGNTPLNNYKQAYGTYQYRLEHPNYHSSSGTINLNAGRYEDKIVMKPAFGYVAIKSNVVGAEVLLDGKTTGKKTPCTLNEVASGRHTITLRLNKYAPHQQEVTVEDGQTAQVSVSMDARFASVSINSLQGAQIYCNGKVIGTGRCTEDMMEGYYDLEARLDHHKPVTKQIQVVAGQSQEISLNPTPIYGSLDIISTPRDATITIDGKTYGKTPFTIEQLLEGNHQVTLQLEGYNVENRNISIRENESTSIDVSLSKPQNYTEAMKGLRDYWWQRVVDSQNNLDQKSDKVEIIPNSSETAQAIFQKGEEQYKNKNYEEAYRLYKEAAEQGYACAQYNLGGMYQTGQGVPQNHAEAVKWYRKAAEQGDASAQSQLGVMYAFGLGVPQNENEAAKWWRKAAEQGDAVGQFNYASVFVGKKDYNEAVKWLRKAAEQGFDEANKQLKILEKYIR